VGRNLDVWHVSIGVVLLALRIGWASKQSGQHPRYAGSKGTHGKAGQFLQYLVMALVPVTGLLYMVGNRHGPTVFGAQPIAGRDGSLACMAMFSFKY
jgi:cytochrome b561